MTDDPVRERALRTISPAPPSERPARFAAWSDDIKARSFELWSTLAAGSAPRVEHLLAQEADEGAAVPAASTIRAWAAADGWAAQRDANWAQTQGRTLRQLQALSLAGLTLAVETMLDAMSGALDSAPYGGAGRVRAAEAMLKLGERSGIRLVGIEPDEIPEEEHGRRLTVAERSRRMREAIAAENALG